MDMNVNIDKDELREIIKNKILEHLKVEDLYKKNNISKQFQNFQGLAAKNFGCLKSCRFCGAVCEQDAKGHSGGCTSKAHRIVGLDGCTKG